MNSDQPIMLIEDDHGHARLIEKNLLRSGMGNQVIHIDDGVKALDHLLPALPGDQEGQPLPALILLDLNLPGCDGFEVLERLKQAERTRGIPVIILSTTDNPAEVTRCYELGCNLCLTKPVDYALFADCVHRLAMLLAIVNLPAAPCKPITHRSTP